MGVENGYLKDETLSHLHGGVTDNGMYIFTTAYGSENPDLLSNDESGTTIGVETNDTIEELSGIKPGDYVTYEATGDNGKHGKTMRVVGFATTSGRPLAEVENDVNEVEVWGVVVGQEIKGIVLGRVGYAENLGNINDWTNGRGKITITHEIPGTETNKAVIKVVS